MMYKKTRIVCFYHLVHPRHIEASEAAADVTRDAEGARGRGAGNEGGVPPTSVGT